jgi:hypothetical protein
MERAQDVATAGIGRRRRDALRWVLATTATLLVVAVTTAAAPAAKPPVKTLVSFPGVARAFTYDAGRIAWIDSAFDLRIRTLRTNTQKTIGYANWYEEVKPDPPGRRLVLERSRLLWLSTRGAMPDSLVDCVYTGTVGSARAHRLTWLEYDNFLSPDRTIPTTIAGDASGFSYGIAAAAETEPDSGLYEVGGGVWSIVGGNKRQVPGIPPAFVLARAAGRVAIVPAVISDPPSATAVGNGTVEIRNATSGALISSFPTGTVRALALSKDIAAELEGSWVNLFDVATGELLGSTSVPADTASELDIEGPRIIFRTNHAIKLLNTDTGRVSTLATTTPWRPSGLAIDGRTVAWAESKRIAPGEVSRKTFKTRIRAITLTS